MKNSYLKFMILLVLNTLILSSSCTKDEMPCLEEQTFSCEDIIPISPLYKTSECEGIEDYTELHSCGLRKMLQYIYENLEYPTDATENDIEGDVNVEFQIDTTGFPKNHEVKAGIGYGCNEEAIRLLKLLRYIPARNNCGDITESTMTLYIRFRL